MDKFYKNTNDVDYIRNDIYDEYTKIKDANYLALKSQLQKGHITKKLNEILKNSDNMKDWF